MQARKYVRDHKLLLEDGLKIISANSEAKYIQRVTLVTLLLKGSLSTTQLSAASWISERTLRNWIRIADEDGFERLRAEKQTGRPSRLTNEQKELIKAILNKNTPENYGYKLWDGSTLSDYISKTFNITLGIRQSQRLLRQLTQD